MLHAVVCGCPLSRGGAPRGGWLLSPVRNPQGSQEGLLTGPVAVRAAIPTRDP